MKNLKNMILPVALLIATSSVGFADAHNIYQGQTYGVSYDKDGGDRDRYDHDRYDHDKYDRDRHDHDGYGRDGYDHDDRPVELLLD